MIEGFCVMKNNEFNPITVNGHKYGIDHLKDIKFKVNVEFNNGDIREIIVYVRPTNHLFSKKMSASECKNRTTLVESGACLISYQHHEGNYQAIKNNPPQIKEYRMFCDKKWKDSTLLLSFIDLISNDPKSSRTMLANTGDDKTCLSGILEPKDRSNEVYLVFFTMLKRNSKELNMIIDTAFCVSPDQYKAKKLINGDQNVVKPLVLVIRNIMEGRKPFESLKGAKKKKGAKKNK